MAAHAHKTVAICRRRAYFPVTAPPANAALPRPLTCKGGASRHGRCPTFKRIALEPALIPRPRAARHPLGGRQPHGRQGVGATYSNLRFVGHRAASARSCAPVHLAGPSQGSRPRPPPTSRPKPAEVASAPAPPPQPPPPPWHPPRQSPCTSPLPFCSRCPPTRPTRALKSCKHGTMSPLCQPTISALKFKISAHRPLPSTPSTCAGCAPRRLLPAPAPAGPRRRPSLRYQGQRHRPGPQLLPHRLVLLPRQARQKNGGLPRRRCAPGACWLLPCCCVWLRLLAGWCDAVCCGHAR